MLLCDGQWVILPDRTKDYNPTRGFCHHIFFVILSPLPGHLDSLPSFLSPNSLLLELLALLWDRSYLHKGNICIFSIWKLVLLDELWPIVSHPEHTYAFPDEPVGPYE